MIFKKYAILPVLFVILAAPFRVGHAANIGNATYGIYNEAYEGLKYDTPNPGDVDGAYMGAWNCALSADTPYEGSNSLKLSTWGQNGGAWIQFGYDAALQWNSPKVMTNMSAYSGGTIRFMVKTAYEGGVKIEWLDAYGNVTGAEKFFNRDLGVPLDNSWHAVVIPLSSFTNINLSRIVSPAVFFTEWVASPPVTRTFWVDNVLWQRSTAGAVTVQLKNRSNDQPASSVTWSGVTPSVTGWKAADQYIEVKQTYFTPGWGIQIYTDNTATGANPRYTGTGDPAGLVFGSITAKRLPMCWRAVDVSTTTLSIRQGAPGYPDRLWVTELGDQYPCFLWMKDRGTAGYSDGEDYVTVWDNRGIQHAETSWGGAVSPNYVYLGADFSTALTPGSYATNRLIVELFYE